MAQFKRPTSPQSGTAEQVRTSEASLETARMMSSVPFWLQLLRAPGFVWRVVKSPGLWVSGAKLALRGLQRSPKLFRRGVQGAAIYLGSIAAEKALDAAHQSFPNNDLLAKADTLAHGVLKAEDFLLGGAGAAVEATGSLVKAGYDAIPRAEAATGKVVTPEAVAPKVLVLDAGAPNATVKAVAPQALVMSEHKALTGKQPAIEQTKPALKDTVSPKTDPAHRHREPLNAALAPDRLPAAGGYEAATGITWGRYVPPGHDEVAQADEIALKAVPTSPRPILNP